MTQNSVAAADPLPPPHYDKTHRCHHAMTKIRRRCRTVAAAAQNLKPYDQKCAIFCAFGEYGYTTYDDYDIDHTSATATSRSGTSTSTSTKRLRQLKNSSQQSLRRHLCPRHSRCDCEREEKEPEGDADDDKEEKRWERVTSPVASVRFTPATTEGGC
jgi:hypothetical protein